MDKVELINPFILMNKPDQFFQLKDVPHLIKRSSNKPCQELEKTDRTVSRPQNENNNNVHMELFKDQIRPNARNELLNESSKDINSSDVTQTSVENLSSIENSLLHRQDISQALAEIGQSPEGQANNLNSIDSFGTYNQHQLHLQLIYPLQKDIFASMAKFSGNTTLGQTTSIDALCSRKNSGELTLGIAPNKPTSTHYNEEKAANFPLRPILDVTNLSTVYKLRISIKFLSLFIEYAF